MTSKQNDTDPLAEDRDENGDLVPPWVRFPTYERYTIGWRMGDGEGWLGRWHAFLDTLEKAYAVRLAYLRRHPPAPINWAETVHHVLYPAHKEADGDDGEEQRREVLHRAGLITTDASYSIWIAQQEGIRWPWEYAESPEVAARYGARYLWFWSRQVADLREAGFWDPPEIPEEWQAVAEALTRREVPYPAVRQGLLTLVQMLAAGRVTPPWQLGLTTSDFADTFENDMGYVDAFRLWGMSAFDDREQLEHYLAGTHPPENWERWLQEQFHLA